MYIHESIVTNYTTVRNIKYRYYISDGACQEVGIDQPPDNQNCSTEKICISTQQKISPQMVLLAHGKVHVIVFSRRGHA